MSPRLLADLVAELRDDESEPLEFVDVNDLSELSELWTAQGFDDGDDEPVVAHRCEGPRLREARGGVSPPKMGIR